VAPVSYVFPAGASFHQLEIGIQAVKLSPISRGSRDAPSLTSEHDRRFSGRRWSPSPFGLRLAIGPRNLPPSSSQLRWGYNEAPHGALVLDDPPVFRAVGADDLEVIQVQQAGPVPRCAVLPGQPISACRLAERLRQAGLRPGQARSTALFGLATGLPAALLARLLGIHISRCCRLAASLVRRLDGLCGRLQPTPAQLDGRR